MKQNPATRPNMVVQPRGWEVAQIIQTGRPTIQTSKSADRIRVTNRELFATISPIFVAGSAPAGGNAFSLGFGAVATFVFNSAGWLFGIAANYDKFRVVNIKFVWQPQMPVTTGGIVALWFDSDPEATLAPAAYKDCSGNMNAKTSMVFEPMEILLKPDQLNRLPQYLTTYLNIAPIVPDTAIVGNAKFSYSTIVSANAALAGATDIGNLWVDYDIEMINPSRPGS